MSPSPSCYHNLHHYCQHRYHQIHHPYHVITTILIIPAEFWQYLCSYNIHAKSYLDSSDAQLRKLAVSSSNRSSSSTECERATIWGLKHDVDVDADDVNVDDNHQMTSSRALLNIPHWNLLSSAPPEIFYQCVLGIMLLMIYPKHKLKLKLEANFAALS